MPSRPSCHPAFRPPPPRTQKSCSGPDPVWPAALLVSSHGTQHPCYFRSYALQTANQITSLPGGNMTVRSPVRALPAGTFSLSLPVACTSAPFIARFLTFWHKFRAAVSGITRTSVLLSSSAICAYGSLSHTPCRVGESVIPKKSECQINKVFQ